MASHNLDSVERQHKIMKHRQPNERLRETWAALFTYRESLYFIFLENSSNAEGLREGSIYHGSNAKRLSDPKAWEWYLKS